MGGFRHGMTSRAAAICASKSGSAADNSMPRGVRTTERLSPAAAWRCASNSLGRITPALLPIFVILRGMFIRGL